MVAVPLVAPGGLRAAGSAGPRRWEPSYPPIRTSAVAITPDRRALWTADAAERTITRHRRDLARGRSIDVGGAPLTLAISPDGRRALVPTAFYDQPALAIVDLRGGNVRRSDVGPEPVDAAFAPDGHVAYVVGGGTEGKITRVDPVSGEVGRTVAVGSHPRSLALTPDGEHALVALNGDVALTVVALDRLRVVDRIKTPAFPREVAISPDGERALVTHNGFQSRQVTLVDLTTRRATQRIESAADPAGVGFTRSGARALVAATGAGSVVVLDGRSGRRLRTVALGGAPHGVAVAGTTAFVADALTGKLHKVRMGVGR